MPQSKGPIILAACSASLATGAVVNWPELFLFSKVLLSPAWATQLPSPFLASPLLICIALAPALLAPQGLRPSGEVTVYALLLPPLSGSILYAYQSTADSSIWFNAPFNFLWILCLHILPPTVLLLAARSVALFARRSLCRPQGSGKD